MNIKDATKILRLEKEIDYMNVEFIEEISLKILNNLKNIVNEKIFNPKNGELTYEIKVFSGRPNARAIIYTDKPLAIFFFLNTFIFFVFLYFYLYIQSFTGKFATIPFMEWLTDSIAFWLRIKTPTMPFGKRKK